MSENTMRDEWIEMVREHEDAHVRHQKCVALADDALSKNAPDARVLEQEMLRAGASASASGARLEGYWLGLTHAIRLAHGERVR